MNVDYTFQRCDLDSWIRQHQVRNLFGLQRTEQINTKIEEIWNMLNCGDNVQPEALLKAIYQSCNGCEWDEEYWTTWRSRTL